MYVSNKPEPQHYAILSTHWNKFRIIKRFNLNVEKQCRQCNQKKKKKRNIYTLLFGFA